MGGGGVCPPPSRNLADQLTILCLPIQKAIYTSVINHVLFLLLQMENSEPISHQGVSTISKILQMLLGSKQRSSTKTVKDSMAGLAWEVLSCNGIRNYKLDLLSYRHSLTLLTLSIPEVLYCNKLSKTVLQKIKFNYYPKAIKHQFCLSKGLSAGQAQREVVKIQNPDFSYWA